MSWRDEYQQGSFRGAPFKTQFHERSGGRRAFIHEFPGRDIPVAEDLGRKARAFTLDCFVAGEGYLAERNALIDALETAGPGLLIHPFHGQLQLVVMDYRQSEDSEEGGIARFSIDFAESGQPLAMPATFDGAAAVDSEAGLVATEAPQELARDFDVAAVAGFVEEEGGKLVSYAAELTQAVAAVHGGIGPALRAFDAGLRFLPANLQTLLRAPLALGQSVVGLVSAISALDGSPRLKVASFERLTEYGDGLKTVAVRTPSRQRQADNQAAFVHLFTSIAAAEMVRAASKVSFSSYEDAVELRERVAARLDLLAVRAADAGKDDRAARFDRLRRLAVRDIGQRGGNLARIYEHAIAATQPSLRIANRLYGAQGVEARAGDIARRNRVRHPGFVAGGRTIRVTTREVRANG
ncbi:MAG: DNA circularization N-terminal domain-containing protein [Blastomonas sp.]